jgi:hypothetical protein
LLREERRRRREGKRGKGLELCCSVSAADSHVQEGEVLVGEGWGEARDTPSGISSGLSSRECSSPMTSMQSAGERKEVERVPGSQSRRGSTGSLFSSSISGNREGQISDQEEEEGGGGGPERRESAPHKLSSRIAGRGPGLSCHSAVGQGQACEWVERREGGKGGGGAHDHRDPDWLQQESLNSDKGSGLSPLRSSLE